MNPVLEAILLILGGILAGIVNTLSGSGTLFSFGIMALLNIPLNIANITSRPGVFFQNLTGMVVLRRHAQFGSEDLRMWPVIMALLGSLLGAVLASIISGRDFNLVASLVMLGLLLQYLAPRGWIRPGKHFTWKRGPKMRLLFFFLAGIYGGFIHIGIGILILSICMAQLGMSYVKANALKLFIILIYTVPTTLYFVYTDQILWRVALLLALGQIGGAWLAATFISRNQKAERWARYITVVMIVVTLVKIWMV